MERLEDYMTNTTKGTFGLDPYETQSWHTMVGERKLSAAKYHYLTCPKRLPRKQKKREKKMEARIKALLKSPDIERTRKALFQDLLHTGTAAYQVRPELKRIEPGSEEWWRIHQQQKQ